MTTARPSGNRSIHRKPEEKGKTGAGATESQVAAATPGPARTGAGHGKEKTGSHAPVSRTAPAVTASPSHATVTKEHPAGSGRAFWSGAITIGLVNVPVRLHTMVRDNSFSFRLLHKSDGQPLRYDRVCSRDGTVVPWTDTVKGYEVRKGEFLVFAPEELKAVMPESDRKIRLDKFVFYLSLDPMYFENSYVLLPDRSEEAYNLLVTALQDLGRAGVGTITLRTKEYPVVVHVYGSGLVLTTLRYADEVIPPSASDVIAELPAPKESELALAKRIITELAGDFAISDFHDHYREAVQGLIGKKLAGEKLVYEAPPPEEAKELMQALKETLATLSAP
ncbi:MAG TPA: Ku protein [Methanoregula sp.]|nr:Ku protein [Methanoregula sp.]